MTIDQIIDFALNEDLGDGDHTSLSIIPSGSRGRAMLLVKDEGILCGIELAEKIFQHLDETLKLTIYLKDGSPIKKGDMVFQVEGKVISILSAERLVLNFMQRLSGIATATRQVVDLLEGLPTKILDTRKTTPLLRELEKYAVVTGGGVNHRMGLYDMIMIKDNHVDFAGGVIPAIEAAHRYLVKNKKKLKIEIEVRNFRELSEVIQHGQVDRIMLDNFTVAELGKAIQLIQGKFETEASGGISINNVRAYAETGVDFISMGALTHQIRSLDMSLKAGCSGKRWTISDTG